MAQHMLVTGAAGYIGGSLMTDLMKTTSTLIKNIKISAAVRTTDQAKKLSALGINTIEVDISDKEKVKRIIAEENIDFILHAANSVHAALAENLIVGLGEYQKKTNKQTYFIHSSVINVYTPTAGWPTKRANDTDNLYEIAKSLKFHHVLATDIAVVDTAKAYDVKAYNIVVPYVYGRGTGAIKRLSQNIPLLIQYSIDNKIVYKYPDNGRQGAAHISDVCNLYLLLVESILQNKPIPYGEKGFYFGSAHYFSWWDTMKRIAEVLHSKKFISDAEVHTWPSYEYAADQLGLPRLYIRSMGAPQGDFGTDNALALGWKPEWDQDRFMASIEDEVVDAQELNTGKSSLFNYIGLNTASQH